MSTTPSRRRDEPDVFSEVIEGLSRLVWRYRVEALMLAVPAATYLYARHSLGTVPAATVVGISLAVVVVLVRHRLTRGLVRAHWRRKVEGALRGLAATCFGGAVPQVLRVSVGAGVVHVRLRLRQGKVVTHVERASEPIAAVLRVREVRARRDDADAGSVVLVIEVKDPFGGSGIAWPYAAVTQWDVWEPVPIGLDEDGETVMLSLVANSVLLGGVPGSGKSSLVQLLISYCALDPTTLVYCLDAKRVELWRWRAVARRFAGEVLEGAIAVLEEVADEMDRRFAAMQHMGVRTLTCVAGFPLVVVFVDELAIYLGADKKQATFSNLLCRLVTMGRAAGVVVVVATQKPSSDIVPTGIRDNMTCRFAFRTTTRDASDMVLGSGWAANGYSSTTVDAMTPGVCLMVTQRAQPQKLRAFHVDDATLDEMVRRAEAIRR